MNKENGFIKNIVIIIVILVIVFLSQQPNFMEYGKNAFNWVGSQVGFYWSKLSNWAATSIYPKVVGEATKRGEAIKEGINNEKNNLAQNVWEKIKNYFADIFSKSTGTQVE